MAPCVAKDMAGVRHPPIDCLGRAMDWPRWTSGSTSASAIRPCCWCCPRSLHRNGSRARQKSPSVCCSGNRLTQTTLAPIAYLHRPEQERQPTEADCSTPRIKPSTGCRLKRSQSRRPGGWVSTHNVMRPSRPCWLKNPCWASRRLATSMRCWGIPGKHPLAGHRGRDADD